MRSDMEVEMTDDEILQHLEFGDSNVETEIAARIRALIAEHEKDQSVIAVWRGRAQRAEAEVERMRALLREAWSVYVWKSDPLYSRIDAALATETTP